jgi:hypothetical protein
MDFLNILKDCFDIEIYYKKMSKYKETEFKNLYNFIKIKWSLIIKKMNKKEYLNKQFDDYSKDFNQDIKHFIKKDIAIALFVKNIIDRY